MRAAYDERYHRARNGGCTVRHRTGRRGYSTFIHVFVHRNSVRRSRSTAQVRGHSARHDEPRRTFGGGGHHPTDARRRTHALCGCGMRDGRTARNRARAQPIRRGGRRAGCDEHLQGTRARHARRFWLPELPRNEELLDGRGRRHSHSRRRAHRTGRNLPRKGHRQVALLPRTSRQVHMG